MRSRAHTHDLPDVFLGRDAVAAGVLTHEHLRGPSVRRLLQGVYSLSVVPDSHELRCSAAGLVLRPGAMLTGRSAATVLGTPLARADDPVEIIAPEDFRMGLRKGVTVRRVRHMPSSTSSWRGFPLAPREQIAFDLAARRTLPVAVGYVDAFARAGHLDLDEWRRWLDTVQHRNRVAVRHAAALADPRAESQPESHLRVALVEAGLPVVPQYELNVAGTLIRFDLALPKLKLGIEYDGAWHALREQLGRDRARLNAIASIDWDVVHISADLMRPPARAVAAVSAAASLATNRARLGAWRVS